MEDGASDSGEIDGGSQRLPMDIFSATERSKDAGNGFPAWYASMRESLRAGRGPYLLGKDRPFPNNPRFKPSAPVPDAFKERIYSLWSSDRARWTPRALSNEFKVSIERAMAIIKLKTLQRRQEAAGFHPNRKYLARMESHLGCREPPLAEASRDLLSTYDPASRIPPKRLVEHFVTPSGEPVPRISLAAASKMLGASIRPSQRAVGSLLKADQPYDPDPPRDADEMDTRGQLFIRSDDDARSRWRYFIVDNDARRGVHARSVLVREYNGVLRRATPVEREREAFLAAKDILSEREMKRQGILPRRRQT